MFEFEFDDVTIDVGSGEMNGTLIVECDPVIEIDTYTAHNQMGELQDYSSKSLEDVKILGATLFVIGNNGEELGELVYSPEEVESKFEWVKSKCYSNMEKEYY